MDVQGCYIVIRFNIFLAARTVSRLKESSIFVSIGIFFSQILMIFIPYPFLPPSPPFIDIRTFKTLRLRRLPSYFNRIALISLILLWELIWLDVSCSLLYDVMIDVITVIWLIRTCIDYHSYITSEMTNLATPELGFIIKKIIGTFKDLN